MELEIRTRPQRKRDSPILRELFESDEEQDDNEDNDEGEEDSESEELTHKKRKRSSDSSRSKVSSLWLSTSFSESCVSNDSQILQG